MISLILPYWDRQEAAGKALMLLLQQYAEMLKAGALEVVVVDDGNQRPFVVPSQWIGFHESLDRPWLRVVRMSLKTEPKSCISAWNEGVSQARGDIIVLSCIEVLHEQPVLEQMASELERAGPQGYVLAAAWCPDSGEWHCHSTQINPTAYPLPAGTGRSFCGMMRKALFWKAGGFDEDYRDGAGYEDVDFVYRMLDAGARFVIRDDLVVTHPKAGATIRWAPGMFERNKDLLMRKWPKRAPVTFVCVKAGSAFGPEYVNNLHDMVARNLPAGHRGRFVCVTDDPTGLDARIETMPLPADLEAWWGKLYLFKRGLFPDGTRMVFMDLDTVIMGRLDEIVKYDGQFATLNDFYYPERVGPAVILWEAGDYAASIWDEWVAEGKPRHPMGDLWWIGQLDQGRFAKRADKLQAIFPGAFVSYKAHCQTYPPKGAKVVCFHGRPRPHEADQDWVKAVWAIGGGVSSELEATANVAQEKTATNVRSACAREIPELEMRKPHDRPAIIVGGGPSLARCLPEIKERCGASTVFATNATAKYLVERAVPVDAVVVIDARPGNEIFLKPVVPPRAFLASQCDPSLFDAAGTAAVLCHMNTAGVEELLPGGEHHLLSSGSTVGLAAMAIAYVLGYRTMYLYGFDSSYEDGHHAYPQQMNDADETIEATCAGRKFKCAPWMVKQASDFQVLASALADDDVTIIVGGDGLIPHVARQMSLMAQQQSQEAA